MKPTEDSEPKAEPPKPRRRGRARRWLIELGVVGALFAGLSAWQRRGLIEAGVPAPPLELHDLSGATVRLADLRGAPVLVHFWATWCSVCRLQHSEIEAVHDGGERQVVAVVADGEDAEKIKAYAAEHGLDYPIWLGDRATLKRWHIDRFPTNYVIDADGNIAARDVGITTRWTTRARIGCAGP